MYEDPINSTNPSVLRGLAHDLEVQAARKKQLADALEARGQLTDAGLRKDAAIFRDEAASLVRRAERLEARHG